MRVRVLVIVVTIIATLGLVMTSLALAQGNGIDPFDEAQREAAAAAAAEAEADAAVRPRDAIDLTAVGPITAPLFVGLSEPTSPAYVIDPATNDSYPLFSGVEIWGAAYDESAQRLFFNRGATLYVWPLNDAPTELGIMRSATSNASLAMIGLAFTDGKLFASRGLSSIEDPEGIYVVDPTTLIATLTITYTNGGQVIDMGGLAADPSTGTLYGTNDQSALRGLVQIDPNGDVSLVAPYPADEDDIDGLAVGGGRAYLVTDEPGDIHVFDFATLTYTNPITNPWTTAELFAAGTWIPVEPLVPSITMTKTVGTDPGTCATTDAISVDAAAGPAEVVYCYTVTNTGNVTLGLHDLDDSELGQLLEGFAYDLAPEASVFLTQTATLTQTTVNTATWTAYNAGPTDIVTATGTATVTFTSPTIQVSPVEIAVELGQNSRINQTMTISNTGNADLEWNLATLGVCYGVEPDWISFEPLSGTTAPGESSTVVVTFDSTGQAPDAYTHIRCVASNDPETPYTELTFTMRVWAYSSLLPVVGGGSDDR